MANYERGSDDVRVFDGGEDDDDVEGSRLPLLIVIALFVLAAFGAVVWLAYQRGVQQGHSELREIAAEPGPVKVAPASPGGTPTPLTGLKIYQQPAASEAEAEADTAPAPAATAPRPVEAAPETAVTATAPSTTMATAPAAPKPVPTVAPPPAAAPKPAVTVKPTAVASGALPATTKPGPASKPAAAIQTAVVTPPPKPAQLKPAVETPAAMTATAPPAGSGLLQIGSYKSDAEARGAWQAYKAKHGALVGGSSIDVQQVELGAKGTWYRLRIVAGSKAEAAALCTKLKAEGGDCLLAK